MTDGPMYRAMKIPLHVLGTVNRAANLGWEWGCNHKNCGEHGIRVDRDSCFTSLAIHWRERHKATGGGQRK